MDLIPQCIPRCEAQRFKLDTELSRGIGFSPSVHDPSYDRFGVDPLPGARQFEGEE